MVSLNEIDAEDLEAFVGESYEMLIQFEQDILSLEKSSLDPNQFNQLYRTLHTLKGNCGFLPFPRLEAIAHAGETLLDTIRTTQRTVTPDIATVLLQLTDAVRQILQTIETTTTEGDRDYSSLIAALTALTTPASLSPTPNGSRALSGSDAQLDPAFGSRLDSTIRVHVDLLDQMMNLVGELVLARNQVMQLTATSNNPALVSTCQCIDLITNELQDGVMKVRMQPISTLWRNLPRLVRDTAIASGKQVALELEGSGTELDRSLIAALKDPLTHLVRNCVDHGIELPQVRTTQGKAAQGNLTLRAFQEDGKVILEIRDDGAGIDPERIKVRAQQLGLITAAQAASLGDRDALDLILLTGFSTAPEVTHLSGRGVGMDVVHRNLESVNGTIEIESRLGQGTTFRLKVPLTLAIIPVLLVSSGGERFAIPQSTVEQLIRIEGREQIDRRIETLLNIPVYRLRGQILPLINLASVLQLAPSAATTDLIHFVVITTEGYRFGLIVDHIEDTQDIVVKPLGKQLKSLKLFSGATVLGDGNVSLILDIPELAEYAGVRTQPHRLSIAPEGDGSDRQLILIVLGPQKVRMGIVLTHATRLEMIPASRIEWVGDQCLMQYRDRIVSLIDLQTVLAGIADPPTEFEGILSVVVITLAANHTVGLIVQQILDIVEAPIAVTGVASRPGVQSYATVKGQVTEILDLDEIVDLADPYSREQTLTAGARR